jgi:cardiolipin synthase
VKANFVAGNAVQLLETGSAYFPALIAAIDSAETEIYLESYIFADDDIGRAVGAALSRAAQRGVPVRVLVDGFGARTFLDGLGRGLTSNGVEVQLYRPDLARLSFRRHRLRRLHRKIAVIDGCIAFIGGINIIDDMDTPRQVPPRFDYAVQVTGPLLPLIHHSASHLWSLVRWANFRRREPAPRRRFCAGPTGDMEAAFVLRDNVRHRRDIEEAYLDAIAAAQEEVVLASAYFLPGIRFRHALMDAARRGVRVVVLLQGRVEYLLLHYASLALYGNLISAGVTIVEYRRSFLHAKVAVIDGYWATVGSSNIDPFSLLLAREANILVRHAGFAGQLRQSLHHAIAIGGTVVGSKDLEDRPLRVRIASWLAYALVRVAVGIAGYGAGQYRA